jgi:hypothetical protein
MKLYINSRASSPTTALVRDQLNSTPVRMPDVVIADTLPLEVYIVDGQGGFDSLSAGAGIALKVALGVPGATPSAGTYKLALGANQSAAIAFNADAAAVKTALEAVTGIGSNNVSVTGTWPIYIVEFIGSKANTDVAALTADPLGLTPSSTVTITTLQDGGGGNNERQMLRISRNPAASQTSWSTITNGWSGSLYLNTQGVAELLGSSGEVAATLEVELTDAGTNKLTLLQTPVTLRGEVIVANSPTYSPADTFYSVSQMDDKFTRNRTDLTNLTGGGTTNLDGVATTTITVGRTIQMRISGWDYLYRLESGTDAESVPWVIRPDDYAAGTNQKVWKLGGMVYNGGRIWGNVGIGVSPTVPLDCAAYPTAASGVVPSYRWKASANQAGNHTGTHRGSQFTAETYASGNYTDVMSIESEALHGMTGAVSGWLTAYQATVKKTNTGTVGTACGLRVDLDNTNATGAISYGYGIYIDAFTETGAITNKFGIYQSSAAQRNYWAGPMQFVSAAAPGTIASGDIWHDSTQLALQTKVAGIKQTLSGCIFTSTATQTFSNTTTETTALGTGVGTLTLPANFFAVGKTVRVRARGTMGTTGTPTLRIRLKLGSLAVLDTTALTLPSLAAATAWAFDGEVVCRTVNGASSTAASSGTFVFGDASGNFAPARIATLNPVASTTFDVASSYAVDLTAQWGTASASNIINGFTVTVEVLN